MIISRTPFRVSFFGGSTDYPSWYRRHGGAVLVTTIDKYCYITARYLPPFFEHRIRLVYSKTECCQTIDEIRHPAVREGLRYLSIERGVDIHTHGDLPARSGLGSSSAFTVGLLHALHTLKSQTPTRQQLAAESIEIEREILREVVGSQDQVAAAHGGFNHVTFGPDGEIDVRPVALSRDRMAELNAYLMLFHTGTTRIASDVAGSYAHDLPWEEEKMCRIGSMVEEALAILRSRADLKPFGVLLDEGWRVKRSLSRQVSSARIEAIYEDARAAGAIGGKLLGAGGGGFMLLFVPPACQKAVRARLHGLLHVPFELEPTGSRILFCDREKEYSAEDDVRMMARRP
jgi:D-glycero-alpha-D-manno-heptose-7-phosphate kinase